MQGLGSGGALGQRWWLVLSSEVLSLDPACVLCLSGYGCVYGGLVAQTVVVYCWGNRVVLKMAQLALVAQVTAALVCMN